MQGLALFIALLSPSIAFASMSTKVTSIKKINSRAGCMACHQINVGSTPQEMYNPNKARLDHRAKG